MSEKYGYYSCRRVGILKFVLIRLDYDYNLLARYEIDGRDCTCPSPKPCKHLAMVQMFNNNRFTDTGWLWNSASHKWAKPPRF